MISNIIVFKVTAMNALLTFTSLQRFSADSEGIQLTVS